MEKTKMTKNPYLSVIIPAYNEVKRLPETLIDIDSKPLVSLLFGNLTL
ncbi:MAG: hypothetical protein AAB659_00145 [Patescibacteria group bacterium]